MRSALQVQNPGNLRVVWIEPAIYKKNAYYSSTD